MNLIDEIILVEAKKKDRSGQQRGPTPGKQGGSDTGKSHQPLHCPHSTAASVRRVVQGTPPPGTMPMSGEDFESDEQGQAMSDYLSGRSPRRGAAQSGTRASKKTQAASNRAKKKKQNESFESRLLEALLSNEEMLLEVTSKNWERRGHSGSPRMGKIKKAALTAAAAAALFAGSYHGTHAIAKKAGYGQKKEPQKTHQTQGHSGTGVSAEDDDIGDSSKPKSMGKGRVTQDTDL